jgi:hypothetical protein
MSIQPRYSNNRTQEKAELARDLIIDLSDENPTEVLPMGYSNTDYAGERIISREGILTITGEGDGFASYHPDTRVICMKEGCVFINGDGGVSVRALEEDLQTEEAIFVASKRDMPYGFYESEGIRRMPTRNDVVLRGKALKEAVAYALSGKYHVEVA